MIIAAWKFYINCLLSVKVYNSLLKLQEKMSVVEACFSGDYLKWNMFCILDTIKEQYALGEKFWGYFTNFLIGKKYCMYEFQLDSELFQHSGSLLCVSACL